MERKRKKKEEAGGGSERWMISYADFLTILLALFVFLYASSQKDVSRLREIADGVAQSFHGNPNVIKRDAHGGSGILKHHSSAIKKPHPSPKPQNDPLTARVERQLKAKADALKKAEKSLQKVLAPLIKANDVSLHHSPLSLRIRLNAKILYPSGKAHLSDEAHQLLTKISGVLSHIPHDYPIVIQGYTNDKPIHTQEFHSNWALSTARAVSVVHLLMDHGIEGHQLSAQGFSKYRPLASNDTPQGLRQNRRVSIVIRAPNPQKRTADLSLKKADHSLGQSQASSSDHASTNSTTNQQPDTKHE